VQTAHFKPGIAFVRFSTANIHISEQKHKYFRKEIKYVPKLYIYLVHLKYIA